MYCTIIVWDLSRSDRTVAALRERTAGAGASIPGLRQQMWISSAGAWGAICLWDDEEAAGSHPSVAGQVGPLIGYGPTSIQQFAVETPTTEIDDLGAIMAGLGMARRSPGRDGAALIPLARLSPEG